MNELDIFSAAVERKTPEDRDQYLDQACGDDIALRQRIVSLLRSSNDAGSFIEFPAQDFGTSIAIDRPIAEGPGTVIGPYKLLQQIGEGGMGVVFMAEQTEPIQRAVALKIIRPGMDTRQVIARFEAERQALAMMDHPNIAHVLDAGTTETGRPYFVMDLVNGVPFTDYCDQHLLTVRKRLELMIQVCNAVQHAHQKGIIHRDLKPSNVLVAEYDGKPVPKIIDFGVAKATAQRPTEHTMFTQYGQIVGTFEYMSPEQARFNQLDIDTRSDIYSLGVLLYELLAGSTPLEKERLRSAAFDEILRIISEEDPPKPSTKLSSSDALLSIAANRHTEPATLSKEVRGELDWIVLKCLEKDRNRRYETAYGLARDVERYLNDEPVTACPPSAGYRFRKLARRNRAALLVASAAFVTLLVLVAGLAVSNRLIAAERARAEEQSRLAQELAHEEQLATNHARAEATKSQAVITLMQEMLAAAHPDSSGGKDLTVRELLDQFSNALESRLKDQPEVEAALLQVIGSVYTRLRLVDQAEPHLRRSLEINRQLFGEDDVRYADSLRYLGWNQLERNRADTDVEVFARSALEISRKHGDPGRSLQSLWLLVLSLDGQSKTDEAEATASDALRLARERGLVEQAEVANLLHHLAWIKIRRGDYTAAERLARESVESHLHIHGDAHPETAFGWTYLGAALHRQGKLREAEKCYRRSLDIFRKSFPEDHGYIHPTFVDMLATLRAQGKFEEAIREYEGAVQLKPESAEAHNDLAWVLADCPDEQLRKPIRAVEHASKAVQAVPANGDYWHTLGVAQYRNGQWHESIDSLKRSAELRNGGDSHDWFFLAMAAWQAGNRDNARKWYDKAVDWMQRHKPNDAELLRYSAETEELIDHEQIPVTPNTTEQTTANQQSS